MKKNNLNRCFSIVFMNCLILFSFIFSSCNFWASITKDNPTNTNNSIEITSLSLGKSTLSMSVGGMDYVSVSIKPQTVQKEVVLSWSYDKSIIECDTSSNWGITITALKEGQTFLKCSYGGYDAICLVTVSGYSEGYESTTEPYIYSNTTVLQTSPGITEKVFVSLYGGDAGDIDGYTWTIDNSSVASIQPTGQYCLITAKDSGYARIKITHTKASYPYYMGIYVFEDATKVSYITTQNNILTMKTGDSSQTVSVNLVNGKDSSQDSSFKWKIVQDETTASVPPIKVESNGNTAIITPISTGSCTVRITHPDATYPLDILCRVITVIKNVYIEPDNTIITIDGDETQTITSTLKNIDENEYSETEFEYLLDDYNVAEIVNSTANQVILKGKANGSCKLLISHPNAKYTREILIIVTGKENTATVIDSSCYITTNQNYIRTKVGADITSVLVSLKGGDDGDESGFIWSVKSSPTEGTRDVIELETTNGTAIHSRQATQTYAYGTAYISPKVEGSAVINITHPKVLYPTEILIKVLSEDAILTEPLYFKGDGIVKILNGKTYDYTVELKGKNKTSSDEESIKWIAEDSRISIASSGATAQISAPCQGSGQTISYVKISHAKCDADKKVLVLTADTQKELDAIKALYSDKLYYNFEVGDSVYCMANSVGFYGYTDDEDNYISYDFSKAQWTVDDSSVVALEKNAENPLGCVLTGLKAGTTTVTVKLEDASCEFYVTVYPLNTIVTEPEIYFTTSQNVVNLSGAGNTATVRINAINLSSYEYQNIEWKCNNANVVDVVGNGINASLTAKAEGEAIIDILHPDSQNTLKIYVRVGSEYVSEIKEAVSYIKTPNVLGIVVGKNQELTATLGNFTGSTLENFEFDIDDEGIAIIESQSKNGVAIIKGISKGYTKVSVSHNNVASKKDVLVIVANTEEELAEEMANTVYLSTSNNTLAFSTLGKSKTITITANNLDNSDYSQIQWTTADNSVASVVGNGINATVYSYGNGYTTITASYPGSINTLTFYVFVDTEESTTTEENISVTTYIKSNNVLVLTTGTDSLLTATLGNYNGSDSSGFSFTSSNTSIAKVIGQSENGSAYITGVSKGCTEIAISNSKAAAIKKVLVIVGATQTEVNSTALNSVYLSTKNNTVAFTEKGKSSVVNITASNLDTSLYSKIKWTTADSSVATVIGNGTSATIYAKGSGETEITANYSESLNSLTFYVFVGTEDVTLLPKEEADSSGNGNSPSTDSQGTSSGSSSTAGSSSDDGNSELTSAAVYIKSVNVLGIVVGKNQELTATLGNFTGSTLENFEFDIDDESIAIIESQSKNGVAIIKGISKGYTKVSVSHNNVASKKDVLVIVANTEEELAEEMANTVYLSVNNNTIDFTSIGDSKSVSITANNLNNSDYQKITWKSSDTSVATVIGNGTTAKIYSRGAGYTTITASYPGSINTLTFYVFVNAEKIVQDTENDSPAVVYISSSNVITMTKEAQSQQVQAVLVNYSGSVTSGFSFSIDDESVAKISAQTTTGIAYVKPISVGQAKITISHTATKLTKEVLVIVGNSEEELAGITYLTTSQNVVAIGEGNTKNVSVSVKNSDDIVIDGYTWISSNPSVVGVTASGANAILTGNSIGTAMITVSNKSCKYPLTIIAQVVDPIATSANPYIQLTSSVLTLTVSSSFTNITADLVGGDESDFSDFTWTTNDSSICVVYGQNEVGKIRALKEGTTYITVNHPKAVSPAQILVVCDKKVETECSISVPSSIITMKPTDSSQTVTASLINGSTNDKYNFKWSLDVYDVIDFQYSANVCTITPKQSGSCTITVSHPKAAYEQQIIVNVQEYTSFSFPDTNTTITQGNVSFITMQVPTTKVTTHVEYSVDNSAICSISGTKAVAQLQAIKSGTTTVRAKLVASSTGVVQAESEMMVYVKEKATDSVYITASTTIYTVQKGKSQTLSANLSGNGVLITDSSNLTWSTNDSDVIQITGISSDGKVRGKQIYITALKSGEALITCSHEKAASSLQFYVVVPGSAEKVISLNKNYITLTKGTSGTTIKANIENAESSNDYSNLVWTCADVSGNGAQIARVMGSQNTDGEVTGQTVTIYPLAKGEAIVTAQLPDVEKAATCTVIVQEAKSFTFEQTSSKVQPFQSAKVKYTVSPPDAELFWTTTQDDDYFEYSNLGVDENGVGYLQINGIKEGNGMLYCVTADGAKGTLSVKVSWDYKFTLDLPSNKIEGEPTKTYSIAYNVNPNDAKIEVIDSAELFEQTVKKDGVDSGRGVITLMPKSTGSSIITIKALNPNADNAVIGSYSINAKISYSNLTITPQITKDIATNGEQTAYYSNIAGNTIYVGDGETITVKLNCAESKVTPIYNFSSSYLSQGLTFSKISDDTFTISSSKDETQDAYLITEGYEPTYNGSRYYSDGKKILPSDFEWTNTTATIKENLGTIREVDFTITNTVNGSNLYSWEFGPYKQPNTKTTDNRSVYVFVDEDSIISNLIKNSYLDGQILNDKNYRIASDGANDLWGCVRNTSLDGTCIPADEFRNSPWYYWKSDMQRCEQHRNVSVDLYARGVVDTNHIKATYKEYTLDTKVISDKSGSAGTLEITVSDSSGYSKIIYFPIYLETRYCKCTYKE